VIGVDQEGGTVAHLGEVATALPSFMAAGAAVAGARARGASSEGEKVVADYAEAIGFELRSLGFTWVFAPVADVTIGPADVTIGTRSPSSDPEIAAPAAAAAVRGFSAAAVVSTAKHFPGHGSVTEDSHKALPVQRASAAELSARDLVPFRAVAQAGAPAMMMSHLAVEAIDPGVPISLSANGYAALREDVGFAGVAVTDSLGMGAVRRGGDPGVRALVAGAAKVIALQRWQADQATGVPVPHDVSARAAATARALSAAAVTQVSGECPAKPQAAVRLVSGTAAHRAAFTAAARRGGLRTGSGSGTSLALVSGANSSVTADIVVALGWPTALRGARGRTEYALYGATPGSFGALVDVLTGRASALGALPVDIGVATRTC
jgi:beta-N-acetylhexosaminidase